MEFLEDMIDVNKGVLDKTIKKMTENWMLIFTGLAYTIINLLAYNVLGVLFAGPLGILSGIAFALLQSSIASNYLYLLFNVVNYNRLTVNNFKNGFTNYIRKIYGVLFVMYLGRLLLSALIPILGPLANILNLIFLFGIPILVNALPETVYLKGYDAWESIVYSLEFLKENFVNWIVPNVIFYGLIFFVSGQILLNGGIFVTNVDFNMSTNLIDIIRYLIAQAIFTFMMVYRGHLFKILSTSTRRKRMFMKKI